MRFKLRRIHSIRPFPKTLKKQTLAKKLHEAKQRKEKAKLRAYTVAALGIGAHLRLCGT